MKNELRIGNYVLSDKIRVEVNGIGDEITTTANFEGSCNGKIEPIPLTEEWLVKFGFKIKYDKYFGIESDSEYLNSFDFLFVGNGVQVFDDNGVKVVLLEFVHYLQNFYYVFNNKDLTLCS